MRTFRRSVFSKFLNVTMAWFMVVSNLGVTPQLLLIPAVVTPLIAAPEAANAVTGSCASDADCGVNQQCSFGTCKTFAQQTDLNDSCLAEASHTAPHNISNVNCTANDISIAQALNVSLDATNPANPGQVNDCSIPGNSLAVTAEFQVTSNADNRYNIGIYFANGALLQPTKACTANSQCGSNSVCSNGVCTTNAQGIACTSNTQCSQIPGSTCDTNSHLCTKGCTVSTLPASSSALNNAPGSGNFLNTNSDQCGDISKNNSLYPYIHFTVPCSAVTTSGILQLPYCTAWSQQQGTCGGPTDAVIGSPSKCNCNGGTPLPVTLPAGSITVVKNTVGGHDGTFGFSSSVPGATSFSVTTTGGTSAPNNNVVMNALPAAAGGTAYSVTEVAQTMPWQFTSVVCTSSLSSNKSIFNYTTDSNGGQVANVILKPNDAVVCTYTNTFISNPTLATTIKLSDGSTIPLVNGVPTVTVGSSVYDTAILSNVSANAGGSVSYTFYNDATCGVNGGTGNSAGSGNVSGATVGQSSTSAALSAGSYSYKAHYSGDALNGSADAPCEPLAVVSPNVHIVKKADANSVSAGSQIGFTITMYNDGSGDAVGTSLSDTLPTNPDLNWQVQAQGAGFTNCAINTGVLSCGPVTIPAGTTQGASTFTVHITSTTTANTVTGSCPSGGGNIDNTASFSGGNGGTGQSSDYVCVLPASVQIVKLADAAQVNAGQQIGFKVIVFNTGAGDASGVKLSDILPTNADLSWSIESQGDGWGSACSISSGVLSCGGANGVAIVGGTTQDSSAYWVHITSSTSLNTANSGTGERCTSTSDGQGTVSNTASVTTTNDGGPSSTVKICVVPNISSTTTLLSNLGPVSIGTAVHDSATLSGVTFAAGGTLTYTIYTDQFCLNQADTSLISAQPTAVTVTNGVVPNSADVTFNAAGTFYWQAVYSGDVNNTGSTSACTSETLVVNPNGTNTTTLLSNLGPIAIGTALHDTATLGGVTANAGGTLSYTIYTDDTCQTLATTGADRLIDAQPTAVVVSNGVVPNSADVTFNAAGTFYWQAVYSGDANNLASTSACTSETLVVSPNTTDTTTLLSNLGPIAIGGSVHDSATLSGVTGNAGGTLSYTIYTDDTCKTQATTGALGVISAQPTAVTVTNGVVSDSADVTFNAAGTFYWQAVYSGDANNLPSTSGCTSETLVVVPNTTATATLLSNLGPIAIGGSVHDSATLSGATLNAGGTLSYTIYTDQFCLNQADTNLISAQPSTVNVTNGIVPNSDDVTFKMAGTFYWQAVYSGDANNTGSTSACTSETLVVSANVPTVTTTVKDANNTDVTNSAVAIGSVLHDTSVIAGATSDAGGTISYNLYSDADCSTKVLDLTPETNTVVNGVAPDSITYTFNQAGTFYFQATYSGDNNNIGPVSSACKSEIVTVNPNTTSATTLLSNLGPIGVGTAVHDSATLIGVTGDAGGTLTYTIYTDDSCQTQATTGANGLINAQPTTVNVIGGLVPNSEDVTFYAPGTFYWQAVYSGDANNLGSSSACTSETLVVSKNQPIVTTKLSDENVRVGDSFTDQAMLTGGFAPTGTVTFNVYAGNDENACVSDNLVGSLTQSGVPLVGGVAISAPFNLSGGQYQIQVVYSGDANNLPATSACGSEPMFIQAPSINIVKSTNGVITPPAAAPQIPVGSTVTWTYLVTNTGNVALVNVVVTDDQIGSIGCPSSELDVGASMTCTATGTAVAGSYSNIGTATGTPPLGSDVSAHSPSAYVGYVPSTGCTLTAGYWKNHACAWSSSTQLSALANDLNLSPIPNSDKVTQASIIAMMNLPTGGNACSSLAQQLVAAWLGVIVNGASPAPSILNMASATFANQCIASISSTGTITLNKINPSSATGAILIGYNNTLDQFNNGKLGVPHCGDAGAPSGPAQCTDSTGGHGNGNGNGGGSGKTTNDPPAVVSGGCSCDSTATPLNGNTLVFGLFMLAFGLWRNRRRRETR